MASPPPKAGNAGRKLVAFLVAVVALCGVMYLVDRTPTPGLGLDLQGGTSITLSARQSEGGDITPESLQTAVEIIRSRVDGTGVAEADISTQGSSTIVVAVPGQNPEGLVALVGTTAELNFRQVLQREFVSAVPLPEPTPSSSGSTSPTPSATTPAPTTSGTTTPAPSETASTDATTSTPSALGAPGSSNDSSSDSSTGSRGASLQAGLEQLAAAQTTTTETTTDATTPAASTPAATTPGETPTAPATPPVEDETGQAEALAAYAALDCSDPSSIEAASTDDPAKPLATCSDDFSEKWLLAPATVFGTDLSDAYAGLPQGGIGSWQVNLEFNSDGATRFSQMTTQLASEVGDRNRFAIVLDGLVQSAPGVNGPIPGGRAEITGTFTQAEATELANVLKYGALPLAFDVSDVREVTPTLGSDSLRAGLIAGFIGLGLVLVYALLYYRGLGLVIVGSLVVAGVITYATVVLLTAWIGFSLTLAGVAGLIVAIGITADSFIIYFERIRDEVREGRTLRAAIEHGWLRARRTIIAADVVSLLSAVVLYVVSIGNVRGFAFALGLSTVIDVVIVFLFTKPLMSWIGSKRIFTEGSRWSGLSGDRLGQRVRPTRATSRTAIAEEA